MSKLSKSYSKWDNIELSDDSDIEVHPNVDKKSFVRWKQRDIHDKREERKGKIAFLKSEIVLNNTLLPLLDDVIANVASEGTAYYQRRVSELQAKKGDPNANRPEGSRPDQPSYNDMILALMTTVADEVKQQKGDIKDPVERASVLEKTLREHREQLIARTKQCGKDIETEELEQKKHITSENMREGWNSGHVNKNTGTAQIVDPIKPAPSTSATTTKAAKVKGSTSGIEVLNPRSSGSQADAVPEQSGYAPDKENAAAMSDDDDDEGEDETIPEFSSSAKRFTQLEVGNWEASFKAISAEPALLKEDVNDAILLEAFEAAIRGDKRYAKACVHQSLVLQYCRKLGRDGVALFFKRMATNKDALRVFQNDVNQTWARIESRSGEMAAERAAAGVNGAGEREQIQLVAQDPSTTITFEVPSGPPPEELTISGEGSENMDIEQVKAFLQRRWDIFETFPKNLKKALQTKSLEEVNRVLGKMAVDEGEETVRMLDEAGILSFSSNEIVDKTQEQRAALQTESAGAGSNRIEIPDDSTLVD